MDVIEGLPGKDQHPGKIYMVLAPHRSRRKSRFRLWAVLALVACFVVMAGSGAWGQSKRKARANIEMNFKNVEIANFLTIISEMLDISLVWDETKVRGSITLVSPKKFTRTDALKIFETVLAMHGYTTVQEPGSPIVQVVPTADASRLPSPTKSGDVGKGSDDGFYITQVIPLENADANQVRAALTPLISKTAGLAVYAPGNVLVLSDTEANVRRVMSIVKEMDVEPEETEYIVIQLKHASARKIAPLLTSLSSALPTSSAPGAAAPAPQPRSRRGRTPIPSAGTDFKVVADDRTNTLILVGEKFVLDRFKEIISVLDVPGVIEERGVRVVRLEHADATDLVKILKDVNIKADQPKDKGAAAGNRAELENATITSDKATNSVIMFGPTEITDTLVQMLSELDVRRPQVYVEVLIMEMTLEKSLQLGVRWQASREVDNGVVGAGVPDATPRTLEQALAAGTGSAIGIVGDQIDFGGQTFTSFSGFIQATRQDQDLNVLANPQVLTLNNQEAEINVSQVVPISTKTVTNNQLQTTTEFEFKDVGIILNLTPQITGENKVRLLIKQESSSIAARQAIANANQQAVTTLKRSINTQVVVDNNTTMAIGGLIQDQRVDTETKVPCLGDIPLLGWLFKSTAEELRKINLVIFIRPRIIATQADLEAATNRVRERFDIMRDPKVDSDAVLRDSFDLPAPPNPVEDEEDGDKSKEESAPAETSPAN